jgi:hypothetical protein
MGLFHSVPSGSPLMDATGPAMLTLMITAFDLQSTPPIIMLVTWCATNGKCNLLGTDPFRPLPAESEMKYYNVQNRPLTCRLN